jgi:glycine betaine/choline ABC-type transport system substrate-binding protein
VRRALATLLAGLTLGCGGADRVVVGGKNFTEQRILGELLAQTLESAGLAVERRLDLGGTLVCDAAIRAGQIDAYVEYTGTALTAVLHEPPAGDAADVLRRVRAAYGDAGLEWLPPLGFDNTFALVVRPDAGVTTISAAVPRATDWSAAFGYEFQSRPDGAPLLERVYGMRFRAVHTMDLGLLYRALVLGRVDLAAGSATDAAIDRLRLIVLDDDRNAFPPYEAAPVVRRDALARDPRIRPALESLAGMLDAAAMRRLNAAVDPDGRSPAEVITAWRAERSGAAAAR